MGRDSINTSGVYSSDELRLKRAELLKSLGFVDDLGLSLNSLIVLERRYLRKDETGRVIETPRGLFRRVAHAIASIEDKYGGDVDFYESRFYDMLCSLEFLPNTPTLMNAGLPCGQLSGCFVLPIDDSLDSIFTTLKNAALIHQSGGGVGYNFSHLRPAGDVVRSTGGVASGPVSFMRVYDVTTDVVKQGGRRRGANMAILNHDHPDVLEFINAKKEGGYANFNFSVGVSDDFMRKVVSGSDYWTVNPRTGKRALRLNARKVFGEIVRNAWISGDPGLVFLDEVNRKHPLPERIEGMNPCGEQPLLPYESCNLGSINVSLMIKDGVFDWARLERVTRLAVRFLDDVIDANVYPLREINELTKANRKIGLGVMGLADLFVRLGIPYDSFKALGFADKLMGFIERVSHEESMRLGLTRGSFPHFRESKWVRKFEAMRNSTVTTIAPTGSISIIAGCSSGIEPLFAIVFTRNILEGSKLLEVNKYFESIARSGGFYSRGLMSELAVKGGLARVKSVPDSVKRVFVTALDISPEWHVKMQAVFQKHVDNAVSKTVNLPSDASISDVAKAYLLAYKLKCKGITVYRYGSKDAQVLTLNPEFAGGCPKGTCNVF